MAEFGVAASLSVEVDDASLQAARTEIERELGDITVTPATDTTAGGGPSSALPMTDGGATVGEQLAEQTDLLEDIEDRLADGAAGGGGTLLAGGAGTLLAGGAGLLASAGGGLLGNFIGQKATDIDPDNPNDTQGTLRERLGLDPTYTPEREEEQAPYERYMEDIDIPLSTEGLTEATADAGETMAGTWAAAVDSRVDSIFDGSVGERIGANMMMALDPTGLGETLGQTAQSELSSMFDGILGGNEANRPTDAQTIMDNNEGALMPSDRGLAEAAAKENRARQQRQDRKQMDVDVGPIDFDLSGLDEIDQRLDDIADRVKERIREEVLGS